MYRNNRDSVPSQQRRIKPTRRSVSGAYAFRGHSEVEFESTLERDFIMQADFNLNVLDVIPQPASIPFRGGNGQEYTYTPDFLVYYRLGNHTYHNYPKPRLVEVKPEAEWRLHWRTWLPKWKAAYRYAQIQGWEFHIHDESRIRNQALDNIRWLNRYKNMQFPVQDTHMLTEAVRDAGSITFEHLLSRHFLGMYRAVGQTHIWHLIATRKFDCDITKPLNQNTELWMAEYE
ncbi:TnsA endonuclease N-terminal domain-containing protein [Pseudomonas graminis]